MNRAAFKIFLLMALGLLALPAPRSFCEDAPALVKKGIAFFLKGDYGSAQTAFSEADVALPDNLRIGFDRACASMGQNDMDRAIPLLQASSMSRNSQLARFARYNLGSVAAARATALFGKHPEAAAPKMREEGIKLLMTAAGHFRDCLKLYQNDEDARYNLELIRLWIKHMEAVWKEKDLQKNREEMNLLEFLEMIEQRQLALHGVMKLLAGEEDSPRCRQALAEAEEEQRALAEEIDPLKAKIEQSLAGPDGPVGNAPPGGQGAAPGAGSGEKTAEALYVLKGWADEAKKEMLEAADFIAALPEEALPAQIRTAESLDRIFGAVAPFPRVIQKALATQQAVVDGTAPLVETPEEGAEVDYEALAWPSDRVSGWSDILVYKAKEGLKSMEAREGAAQGGQAPPGMDQETQKKAMEGLKKSMEKAMELCPKVSSLTRSAAVHLRENDAPTALPEEEEALRLLKEIAEELPKQDQQQEGEPKQDPQQDGQKKEENQQNREQQRQQQQKKDLSKEEAAAILQKAKEREREHKEKQEALRGLLQKPGKVEKDW